MSVRSGFGVLAFVVTVSGLLIAQQPQSGQVQPRQPAQAGQVQPGAQPGAVIRTSPAGQQASWMVNDHYLASCVAISNQAEIAVAEFALKRTENAEVKEFAEMLIADHGDFVKKLARWSPEAAREGYLEDRRAEGNETQRDLPETSARQNPAPAGQQRPAAQPGAVSPQPGVAQPRAGVAQTQPAQGRQIDAINLFREMAIECVSSAKQALSEKEGDEFDKCFVGAQILLHAQMQDKLTVFQRHASSELSQAFSDASETVDQHMDHAKAIMEKWEGRSKSTAEREKPTEKRE
jgi:predicted outer membrane protein